MLESEITFAVYKPPQGGYVAVNADGAIIVYADKLDVLKVKVEDAVRCQLDESKIPAIRLVDVSPKAQWIGSAKGEFTVPDDFNDPLPKEIEDLFW